MAHRAAPLATVLEPLATLLELITCLIAAPKCLIAVPEKNRGSQCKSNMRANPIRLAACAACAFANAKHWSQDFV
jgi:hypothetical protein